MNEPQLPENLDPERQEMVDTLVMIMGFTDRNLAAQYCEMSNWNLEAATNFALETGGNPNFQTGPVIPDEDPYIPPEEPYIPGEADPNYFPPQQFDHSQWGPPNPQLEPIDPEAQFAQVNADLPDYEDDDIALGPEVQYLPRAYSVQPPTIPAWTEDQKDYNRYLSRNPETNLQGWFGWMSSILISPITYPISWIHSMFFYKSSGQSFLEYVDKLRGVDSNIQFAFSGKSLQEEMEALKNDSDRPLLMYIHNIQYDNNQISPQASVNRNKSIIDYLLCNIEVGNLVNEKFTIIGVLSNNSEQALTFSGVNDSEVPAMVVMRKSRFNLGEVVAAVTLLDDASVNDESLVFMLQAAVDSFNNAKDQDRIFQNSYQAKEKRRQDWLDHRNNQMLQEGQNFNNQGLQGEDAPLNPAA
jgi:hypothetical protein